MLKRLFLVLAGPVFFLGSLELFLRVSDFGLDSDFLVSAEVEGSPVWVENPFFTYSMFDPPLARIPASIVARKQKPKDVFRVVVLGESAALGDPLPDFGVPRVLEFALRHADPQASVEVVNAGITAINSHAIKHIARDLNKLQPDVVILYIGNNEVIGPFGPGTTFSAYLASDTLIALAQFVNRLQVAQFLRQGVALLRDRRKKQEFGGVGMFVDNPVPHNDRRLDAVRRRYEKNLGAIIKHAKASGAHVLISTVAVNRRACPPSISTHRNDFPAGELMAWERDYNRGKRQAKQGVWSDALATFQELHHRDPHHAALNYLIATCLNSLNRDDEARYFYDQAMNLDAFRYRTDDGLNDILRRLASTHEREVTLVDADLAFRQMRRFSDQDLFIDHVHFSFEGNAQLASIWMEAMTGLPTHAAWTNRLGFPDTGWLKNEMMFNNVAEISIAQEMARRYSKPPFTFQLNHTERLSELQKRAAALNDQLRMDMGEGMPERFRERLVQYPDDLYFSMHYAQQLITMNRYREAREIAETFMRKYPHRRGPRTVMAHLLARVGRSHEAASVLFDYQPRHGYFAAMSASYIESVLTASGQYHETYETLHAMMQKVDAFDYRHRIIDQMKRTRRWAEDYALARQHIEAGDYPSAEPLLANLHNERPDLGEPLAWIGITHALRGEPEKGMISFRQGLQRMNFIQSNYFAGLWLAHSGDYEEAIDMLQAAASQSNDDVRMLGSIAWIFAADPRDELRDPARAQLLLKTVEEQDDLPSKAMLLDVLAVAHAHEGNSELAIQVAREAISLAKDYPSLVAEIEGRLKNHQQHMSSTWGVINRPLYYF